MSTRETEIVDLILNDAIRLSPTATPYGNDSRYKPQDVREPRYKLLGGADIQALPPLEWRIKGVLPAQGIAALYGPSASGKSFLGLDMAASVANGRRWFDCRIEQAAVVYVCLEGEAGFRQRVMAWEQANGCKLPESLYMVLQPFKLTEHDDVLALAGVVPAGAVVFVDTLNRAAPTADENTSRDMGEILEATKLLQSLTGGLVVLIHHSGKDSSKGLRGHSSLFAAMDACIEVSRNVNAREWQVAKSKDGSDGKSHGFVLEVVDLGKDDQGDEITSCVVVAHEGQSNTQKVKLPTGGNQKIAVDALGQLFQNGEFGKNGAPSGRASISLDAAVRAVSVRLTVDPRRRKERAEKAIESLVANNILGCNDGWLWYAA